MEYDLQHNNDFSFGLFRTQFYHMASENSHCSNTNHTDYFYNTFMLLF